MYENTTQEEYSLGDEETPDAARRFRQLSATSTKPNFALAGIIFSIPTAIIALVGLLVAGVAVGAALLITLGLQTAAFCGIIVLGLVRGSRANAEESASSNIEGQTVDAADFWWVHPRQCATGNQFRSSLIAPNVPESRRMAADLAGIGHEIHHCTDPDAMIASIKARPGDWDLVIYDTDAAPDLESAVGDLLDLREVCPTMPVVLISNTVLRDELSSERDAWDVTLLKPVARNRLFWAVAFAGKARTAAAEQACGSSGPKAATT